MKKDRKHDEPSKASLRDMLEIDFSKAKFLGRGLYAKRVREAVRYVPVDTALFDPLGGTEGILNILRAVASVAPSKPARKKSA